MGLTITEALAEIKTIDARVGKKQLSIAQFLVRKDGARDPLSKDGGSILYIERERQSISDLLDHKVVLRRAIQSANESTLVTIEGITRPIADWLVWRREVVTIQKNMLTTFANAIQQARVTAQRQGVNIIPQGGTAEKLEDILINISEKDLAADIEQMEKILGQLDGKLSLLNATTQVVL